jgi:hypothetical protein
MSNNDGTFTLNESQRGEYELEVSATGFKQFVRRGIQLPVGQQARVDVQLDVGSVSEPVEVAADASLLQAHQRSAAS